MNESIKSSVLVISDKKTDIMTLTHMLSPSHTVYVSRGGKDALEIAHEYVPDLILLDLSVTNTDGYSIIDEIKSSEITKTIPVILMKDLTDDFDKMKKILFDGADFITKPFHSAIVNLRVNNQMIIINQRRELEKQLKQQVLMASISLSLLSITSKDELLSNTLHMVGEFMEIAQVLLFEMGKDDILTCKYDWIDSKLGLPTRVNSQLPLEEPMLSFIKGLRPGVGKDACLHSNDPSFKAAMRPYRVSFVNYITTPFFVNGEMCGILDFSKAEDGKDWSESEINLATHVASILSGIYERLEMERSLDLR